MHQLPSVVKAVKTSGSDTGILLKPPSALTYSVWDESRKLLKKFKEIISLTLKDSIQDIENPWMTDKMYSLFK